MLVFILKYCCVALVFLTVFGVGLEAQKWLQTIGRGWWRSQRARRRGNTQAHSAIANRYRETYPRKGWVWIGLGLGTVIGSCWANFNLQAPLLYVIAGLGAIIGGGLPGWWQRYREQERIRLLARQFPDALELMSNSMRAGLSLQQAMEVVAQESRPPLNQEFLEAVRDFRLGLSPEAALEKMYQRWPHPDLELLLVAVGVTQRTGGNLAEVATRMVVTVRERFRLKARIQALTAQGKLSGWIVGLMPLALLVGMTLLDPKLMLGFFRHPLGWLILGSGLVMELVGAFFIRKIVNIEA